MHSGQMVKSKQNISWNSIAPENSFQLKIPKSVVGREIDENVISTFIAKANISTQGSRFSITIQKVA